MQACLLAISARTPSRRHRHDRHRFGTMQGSVSNRRTCDCRAGPAAMCGPRPSWPLAPAPHVHTPPPGFAGAPDLGNSLACNIVSTLFRDGAVRLAITAANVCCSSMPGGCWLCAVLTSSAGVVVRAPPCACLRPARCFGVDRLSESHQLTIVVLQSLSGSVEEGRLSRQSLVD